MRQVTWRMDKDARARGQRRAMDASPRMSTLAVTDDRSYGRRHSGLLGRVLPNPSGNSDPLRISFRFYAAFAQRREFLSRYLRIATPVC